MKRKKAKEKREKEYAGNKGRKKRIGGRIKLHKFDERLERSIQCLD